MVRFTWDLGGYCNFRCSYCFYSLAGWEYAQRLHGDPKAPEEFEQGWKAVRERYGSCPVYVSGGEPFAYPRFTEIIARVTRYHPVHITTNLSFPLEEFIAGIDPGRAGLNATFHPLHMDPLYFARQLLRLKEAGFTCGACYLAHPLQLGEMLHYKRFFFERGIALAVTLFSGPHRGKEYPAAYTPEENEYIAYAAGWSPEQDERSSSGPPPGPSADEGRAEPAAAPAGGSGTCKAGIASVVVGLNGDVRVCGRKAGPVLGNLYRGNIELLKEPRVCDEPLCGNRE